MEGQTGVEPVTERRGGERRAGERRASPGRRAEDVQRARAQAVQAGAWALLGALILVYLFFVAIGGIAPSKATGATIAVGVLGVLWLAHAWRRLAGGGTSPRADRERRGF